MKCALLKQVNTMKVVLIISIRLQHNEVNTTFLTQIRNVPLFSKNTRELYIKMLKSLDTYQNPEKRIFVNESMIDYMLRNCSKQTASCFLTSLFRGQA
jgi:hypothetical protein